MISWFWESLRGRIAGSAIAGALIALIIMGVILYTAFLGAIETLFDNWLEAAVEGLVTTAEIGPDGALSVSYVGDELRFERTFQGWYWQVAPVGAEAGEVGPRIRRSHSLGDVNLDVSGPVERGTARSGIVTGPLGQKLRYVRTDVALGDDAELFRFVVAGDYGVVDRLVRNFLGAMLFSLVILAGVMWVGVWFQLRFAMSPMDHIRQSLADVRSGATARLEGQFVGEVAPLIEELNALLDHEAELVVRARTQVGNLAHALKTPLTVLRNEADNAEGPLAESVRRETDGMRRQVDHYLARARAAASANVLGARASVGARLEAIIRTMKKIYADKNLKLELSCPDDLWFRGAPQDLDEMLGNLIDNAWKWARRRVTVRCKSGEGETIVIVVEDDGAGLSREEIARVTARGERLDETVPGSGLGLAIVSDIAQLYFGRLDLSRGALGGLKADLTLPAA